MFEDEQFEVLFLPEKNHCSHLKISWSVWRWWTLGLPLPAFTLHLIETRTASSDIYKTAVIEIIADTAGILKPDKVNGCKKELWARQPATTRASLESLGNWRRICLADQTKHRMASRIPSWKTFEITEEFAERNSIKSPYLPENFMQAFRQTQFLNDKIKEFDGIKPTCQSWDHNWIRETATVFLFIFVLRQIRSRLYALYFSFQRNRQLWSHTPILMILNLQLQKNHILYRLQYIDTL